MIRYLLIIVLGIAHFHYPGTALAGWNHPNGDRANSFASTSEPRPPFHIQKTLLAQYTKPVSDQDTLVVTTNEDNQRFIVAYSLSQLNEKWRLSLGTSYPRQMSIDQGFVYLSLSSKATVVAINLETGQKVWERNLIGERTIKYSPVRYEDSLYVVANSLYKLNLNGDIIWSQVEDISAEPAVDQSGLYFRTHARGIAKRDHDGKEIWRYVTNTTMGTKPIIIDQQLFVGTENAIISLTAQDGSLRWRYYVGPLRFPIYQLGYSSGRIVFSSGYGDITSLDNNGNEQWTTRLNTTIIQGNGWLPDFIITGSVLIARSSTIKHAILDMNDGHVTLENAIGNPGSIPTGSTGRYIFFKGNDYLSLVSATTWNPSSPPINNNQNDLDPLIVIPGIMESWPINGEWKLDPFLGIYAEFISTLKQVGYEEGVTLFYLPYDWHMSNNHTTERLRTKIQQVLDSTGKYKVDIVAHSMGGLIARSYIQNDSYTSNVDQFISLSVPNHGSAKAYLTWEAGETGDSALDTLKESLLRYEAFKAGYQNNVIEYIHNKVPSVKELLPIFSYLGRDGGLLNYSPCSQLTYPCNTFMETLALQQTRLIERSRFLNIIAQNGNESTMERVNIDPPSAGTIWPHGKPTHYPDRKSFHWAEGDGTVLVKSARIPGTNEIIIESDHTDIVSKSSSHVVKALTGKDTTVPTIREPINRFLFMKFYSPITPVITSPSGKRLGKGITGEYHEIERAYYSGQSNSDEQQIIVIANNEEGTYQLDLFGTGEGDYRVEIETISGSQIETLTIAGTASHEKVDHYSFISNNTTTAFHQAPSAIPLPQPTLLKNNLLSENIFNANTLKQPPELPPVKPPIEQLETVSTSQKEIATTYLTPSSHPSPTQIIPTVIPVYDIDISPTLKVFDNPISVSRQKKYTPWIGILTTISIFSLLTIL